MTATDRVVLIAYDGSRQAKRAVSIVSTFIHEERVILLTAWQAEQMQATRASSMGGLGPAGLGLRKNGGGSRPYRRPEFRL